MKTIDALPNLPDGDVVAVVAVLLLGRALRLPIPVLRRITVRVIIAACSFWHRVRHGSFGLRYGERSVVGVILPIDITRMFHIILDRCRVDEPNDVVGRRLGTFERIARRQSAGIDLVEGPFPTYA